MLRPSRASESGSASAVAISVPSARSEPFALYEGLRYSTDAESGIKRRRAGSGFYYLLPNGRRVSDETTLSRIRKLAIPPAYRDVWICRDDSGHLQATGIDARGRKQYRYHQHWRSVRDAHKFERMLEFGRALPRIRRRVSRDLQLPGMPRAKVLAMLVRLLERTLIRVGNDEYARTNNSYGLTTLRNRHVDVKGGRARFTFRGKHGIKHEVELHDARVTKIVRACLDLPGQELFAYRDERGQVRDVGSSDVNLYLKDIAGEEFTAKDFRTWYATSSALETLTGRPFTTAREAKGELKRALQSIASRLGNTAAMCRKSYVNPVVVDAFLAGDLREIELRGGGDGRVRLLHLLTETPDGAGFKRAGARRDSTAKSHAARARPRAIQRLVRPGTTRIEDAHGS